jgi:hypothetical protein
VSHQSFTDKLWKDEHGNQAVWQFPNAPLVVWLVAMMLVRLLPRGVFYQLSDYISFGALFTWAWLEIFHGSSYIRRGLGVLVMGWLLYGRLHT